MIYNEQRHKIIEEDILYFKGKSFSSEDEAGLVDYAIENTKFSMARYFLENDFLFVGSASIENIFSHPESLEFLQYLETKGLNALELGNGRLILAACLHENIEALDYLLLKAPDDMLAIELSVISLMQDKFRVRREMTDKQYEQIENAKPLLQLLLPKLSNYKMESIYYQMNNEKVNTFLSKEHLSYVLKEHNEATKRNRIKI